MKENETCTSDAEVVFNQMLRDASKAIESAYGGLKARRQILTMPIKFKLKDVPLNILSCFPLYNWCEKRKVLVDENVSKEQVRQNLLKIYKT